MSRLAKSVCLLLPSCGKGTILLTGVSRSHRGFLVRAMTRTFSPLGDKWHAPILWTVSELLGRRRERGISVDKERKSPSGVGWYWGCFWYGIAEGCVGKTPF